MKRFGNTLKQPVKGKPRKPPESHPIALSVRLPLYCAAGGLFVVYGWGALETFPIAMGVALGAVFAMSEFLKPKLGELAAEAMEAKDRLGTWLMLGASFACIALGALGGVIAMGAANGPREAYDAAVARVDNAKADLDAAQARLDVVPTCTPDMPRVRCMEMTLQNAATLADRTQTRNDARQLHEGATAQLAAVPNPGPGVPHVSLWLKALVIAAVEFVLFAVPFSARRRRKPVSMTPKVVAETKQPQAQAVKQAPINDGGWARRRELYGPKGRKPKRAQLTLVAGCG